jgi:tRNA A-37 threonylcarbamoyl transferase component Bud32
MSIVPERIGKYRIVESIGQGGMGMVYKARHPTLDRFVILKKLNISDDHVIRERFRREAEIMIDFRTDYVVDVYDHFREDDADYIVLEYVDGRSLDEILKEERYLRCDLALLIVRDCARGLDYVHSKGVTHRDVKPGNVLIGKDGAVRLLDFGIASRTGRSGDDLTQEGMTLGTVSYIAPEQIEHSRDADLRGDIYSLGATLYEVVTGRKAFPGSFNPETVNRIQRGRYRKPRRANPQVSRFVARLIRRCMHRSPSRRPQTAGRVVAKIDRHLSPARERNATRALLDLVADTRGSNPRVPRPRRRLLRAALIAFGILVLGGAAAAWVTGTYHRVVLADTYGSFQYQIRLRHSERGIDEHHIEVALYRVDESDLATVPTVVPPFLFGRVIETPDYHVLTSRELIRPAGLYEAAIRVDGSVTRQRFAVLPFAVEPVTQVVSAAWDPKPADSLELAIVVRDAVTGDEITDSTVLTSNNGILWSPFEPGSGAEPAASEEAAVSAEAVDLAQGVASIEDGDESETRSEVRYHPGDRVQVRVRHPRYRPAEVVVQTERLSTTVDLEIDLVPRSGLISEEE